VYQSSPAGKSRQWNATNERVSPSCLADAGQRQMVVATGILKPYSFSGSRR
jgi:hypothetical protein